jgi:predicted HTH domain antitoxin
MTVLVEIPDEFAALVAHDKSELPRRLVEDAAIGAYCRDAISRYALQRLLGFETQNELDGFLKARGVEHGSYGGDDLMEDVAALERLGFVKASQVD